MIYWIHSKGVGAIVHEVRQLVARHLRGMIGIGGTWPAMNGWASYTMQSAPLKGYTAFLFTFIMGQ